MRCMARMGSPDAETSIPFPKSYRMKQIILGSVLFLTLACAQIDVDGDIDPGAGDGDGDVAGDGDVPGDGEGDGEGSGGAENGSGGQSQGSGGRTNSSGGATGDGDGDGDTGSGGAVVGSGGAPGSGGALGSGGSVGTGGRAGSGGALGTGGAAEGACEPVTCGGTYPKPTGEICFEFTTGAFGGWQVSNNQGCSITFDDAPVPSTTTQMSQFGAGSHTLGFEGCTNVDVAWSCWNG